MELSTKAWVTDLARMVEAPAWRELSKWWLDECVRRAVLGGDEYSSARAQAASTAYSGGLALLMAIENEVSNRQGEIDGRTARHTGKGTEARTESSRKRGAG